MIDFVTVSYNDKTQLQTAELIRALAIYHPAIAYKWRLFQIDNSIKNRGFAAACNIGARLSNDPHAAEILGFVNPDVQIIGAFIEQVEAAFDADERRMIVGHRFGKKQEAVAAWGLFDWVCGAAFFIRRAWFEKLGGFDERFVWAWEETDLCMATQAQGLIVKSINLPIKHQSPSPMEEPTSVLLYKQLHMQRGQKLYKEKWSLS